MKNVQSMFRCVCSRPEIESIESGKLPAIMGPEYKGLTDLETFAA